MKDKLAEIRRRGPAQEMEPGIEAEMEDLEMMDEEYEEDKSMGVEGEAPEADAGAVIEMLQGMDRDSLAEIRDEIDMLMAEEPEGEEEGMDFEEV